MKIRISLFFFLIFSTVHSQSTIQYSSSQILHQIQSLKTVGSVLYIAAHPDDENTRLISYLTNELHLRTGYLSLTRGDGGQNLIGTEQGDGLGLIRTQELLAARRTDGAEQFFTRANDFGYSKNPEETLSIWDKETILGDMVWTIRKFQPDVIICRFPTTGEGGHGHHTTSAILAEEAFEAAADPNRFPEQLKTLKTWQVKRMFWNTFNFGGNDTTSPDQLKLDVGTFNSLLGKSYGEIASASRTMHKSQGFGVPMQRGEEMEYFKYLKGDKKPEKNLFENLDFSWKRFEVTKGLDQKLQLIIERFDIAHPENSIKDLLAVYQSLSLIKSADNNVMTWVNYQKEKCQELILQCAGLWLEVSAEDFRSVPGETIDVKVQMILRNELKEKVQLLQVEFLNSFVTAYGSPHFLEVNQMETDKVQLPISEMQAYSDPYWLKEKHTVSMYQLPDVSFIGLPENKALNAVFELKIGEVNFKISRPIVYKKTDPVMGEIYRPFEILPPVNVNLSNDVFVFGTSDAKEVEFRVIANKDDVSGELAFNLPKGWNLQMENSLFELKKKGDEAILKGKITPPTNGNEGELHISLLLNNENLDAKSIVRIEYDHIPYQFYMHDAEAKLIRLDLKKGGLNIGYIPGAGDKVAELLSQVGYQVTILSNEDLENNLSKYDAIVTGVRAFNVNPKLLALHEQLMNYVHNGGNLIVQYNTNNRIAPLKEPIGPYAFTITTKRVTDETATVEFIDSKARVLNQPNVITQDDFKNWIQERGLYFADEIDSQYEKVFKMNDKGESPLDGSLIIGNYGKGHFVYTGLAFFRELPAGVPGAYRLFANLLGL